jgi:hypothetical protein
VGTFAMMGMRRRVARRVRSWVMYSFLSGTISCEGGLSGLEEGMVDALLTLIGGVLPQACMMPPRKMGM